MRARTALDAFRSRPAPDSSLLPPVTPHKMAHKLIIALAACLALASGMVRREAAGAGSGLEEMQKHATEFQKVFSEQLNALTNSKNTQDLNKALKEGSDSVLQQLSAFSSTLQKVMGEANGKAKDALEQTRASVERSVQELRQKHPEVEQQANQLKDKLSAAVQNTVQESQKLAKEVAASMEATNAKLAPQIKQAYDDFVKHAEEVQKKLHEAATKQ